MPLCLIDSSTLRQRYYQQKLYYCTPVMSPSIIISIYFAIGIIALILGVVFAVTSKTLFFQEYQIENNRANTLNISAENLKKLNIQKSVMIYYKLPYYYQNVRTYVQNVNFTQLLDSKPFDINKQCFSFSDMNIPCTIQWKTIPQIQFNIQQNGQSINYDTENIIWKADEQDLMFGSGFRQLSQIHYANGSIDNTTYQQKIVWYRHSAWDNVTKPIAKFNLKDNKNELNIQIQFKQSNEINYENSDNGQIQSLKPQYQDQTLYIIIAQYGILGASKETEACGVLCFVVMAVCFIFGGILCILWCTIGQRSKKYNIQFDEVRE